MSGTVLTTDDLPAWREYFDRLERGGAYHEPTYLATLAGNFEPPESAELYVYEPTSTDTFIYYPYLRRPLSSLPYSADGLVLEEYSDIVSSWYYGGPLLSNSDAPADLPGQFVEAFGETCAERGIVAEFVRFDPNLSNHGEFPPLEPTFNRKTVPVDLRGSRGDIWDAYEDRNRRAIRQARDTDLFVEPSREPTDVEAFHRIYRAAMEAKEAASHYRFDLGFFHELILDNPALATLLVVRYGGDVVGGFIAVHDEQVAHHYLSASVPEYWDMRVNNLLYHEVVMHMKDAGKETFDFQGGRPGVFKFKKGFSPLRRSFHVATRVHLTDTYDRLVSAAESAGLDTDSDYFPAYRVEESN